MSGSCPRIQARRGSYITYSAYPGDTVTIDGQYLTVPPYSGLFDLSGKSWIRVTGFRVINSNEGGILGDNSAGLVIDHNYTYNTGTSGISVWGCATIEIYDNEVERACTGLYQESISVSEAFAMHTTTASWVGFEEQDKGTLEIGKLADIAVVSEDPLAIPPEKIRDLRVDLTLVGGEVKYRA
jgi:hypothetical protein